ncbi:MAG: cell division protein CrgA [Actinomycetota bacterium]
MPKSKSKRRRYQPPAKPKPPPSPKWVPAVVFGFIILGFLVILARYILGTSILPILDKNWIIAVGLGLIAVGFGVSTKWR